MIPILYPPSCTLGPPRQRPYFTSTDDLISRFGLLPAYDRYVRPFINNTQLSATQATAPTSIDKGKGKEIPIANLPTLSAVTTPGTGHDRVEEEGAGKTEKKWRNNYKHLIKGIPGKHHHLSLHLPECLRDFGPVHSWWAYPFERFNGIIQRTKSNKRVGSSPLHHCLLQFLELTGTFRRTRRNVYANFLSNCYPEELASQ